MHDQAVRVAIVAERPCVTNDSLARAGGEAWCCMTPAEALAVLARGDCALGRLDVLPTLDGIDGGLRVLGELEARGVRILNSAGALLAAHDKLVTARVLEGAGLPHPRTRFVSAAGATPPVAGPVVVKPRFGSWGRAVRRCENEVELAGLLERLQGERWFARQGALVQRLVEPVGYDLRLIVAAGRVVGAISRVAAAGEWRTNVSLGATRRSIAPPADAVELALAAAGAVRADLVGVDLLPDGDGWTILELNGAVDFTAQYSPAGDIFRSTILELERRVLADDPRSGLPSAIGASTP